MTKTPHEMSSDEILASVRRTPAERPTASADADDWAAMDPLEAAVTSLADGRFADPSDAFAYIEAGIANGTLPALVDRSGLPRRDEIAGVLDDLLEAKSHLRTAAMTADQHLAAIRRG